MSRTVTLREICKSAKIVEIMENRIFRESQKPWGPGYPRKHGKSMKISQKGTSRTTFGCYFIKYSRGLRPLPKEGGGLRPPPSWRGKPPNLISWMPSEIAMNKCGLGLHMALWDLTPTRKEWLVVGRANRD